MKNIDCLTNKIKARDLLFLLEGPGSMIKCDSSVPFLCQQEIMNVTVLRDVDLLQINF